MIYRDDAWGTGLADAFAAAWDGQITAVPFAPAQTTIVAELRLTAGAGAQALVVIASETEAVTIIREALDLRLYHQFTFGDAARSPAVVGKIGGQHLGGMLGTAGATAPDNPATDGWETAFVAGDLERGHIGIWRFTEDERIETVDVVPWQR